ncbi:MAG: hypothetical protein R2932_60200 [Caldilineaceae bacterium]
MRNLAGSSVEIERLEGAAALYAGIVGGFWGSRRRHLRSGYCCAAVHQQALVALHMLTTAYETAGHDERTPTPWPLYPSALP